MLQAYFIIAALLFSVSILSQPSLVPLYRQFSEWEPEKLPVTRTNGPVALTLRQVTFDENSNWAMFDFQVTALNSSWSTATTRGQRIEDASGNSSQSALSLQERAWRVRTWTHRQSLEAFSAKERITFSNIVVPAPAEFVALGKAAELNGVKLDVWGCSGEGSFVLTNGFRSNVASPLTYPGRVAFRGRSTDTEGHTFDIGEINGTNITETWSGPKPFLLFEAIGALERDWVQVYVRPTDQLEKKSSPAVWVRVTDPGSTSNRKLHTVDIDEKPGTVVTIDIVISRGLQFEFYVAPPKLAKVAPPVER